MPATFALSESAVAVLRFRVKGYRMNVTDRSLEAFRGLGAAGIMEPVPGADGTAQRDGGTDRADVVRAPDASHLPDGPRADSSTSRLCSDSPILQSDHVPDRGIRGARQRVSRKGNVQEQQPERGQVAEHRQVGIGTQRVRVAVSGGDGSAQGGHRLGHCSRGGAGRQPGMRGLAD
jgi:hypothetical protein